MEPTISLRDLPRIRWSLLFALLLSLLGFGIVKSSLDLLKEMQETHARVLGKRQEIQGMLSRVRNEELEIRQKLARYEELVKHGYVGQEHRLEWVAQIRAVKERRKVFGVKYELAPQQSIDNAAGGGYELMSSSMKLQMQLLHEEDLLDFLTDLRGSVQAYLRIRACDVERLATGGNQQLTSAQLKAECTIDWITWRVRQ